MTMCMETSFDELVGTKKGHSCFIVGCGPSLDKIDLNIIPGSVDLFAVNAAVTLFPDSKRWPNVTWIFRDIRVVFEMGKRLESIKKLRIFTHKKARNRFQDRHLMKRGTPRFYIYNVARIIHQRCIIEDALQLVRDMGYATAYLVGVDHIILDSSSPYAKAFDWKPCHSFPKTERRNRVVGKVKSSSMQSMVRSMQDLKPKLGELQVFNTSPIYPVPVFDHIDLEEAVKNASKPVRARRQV